MDSQETVKNLLSKDGAERIGLFDFWWKNTIPNWARDEGYPINDDGKPCDPYKHFGYDIFLSESTWFDALPIVGVAEIVEETDKWEIKRNGAGALLKWWKDGSGTPEHVDFEMTNRAIWEEKYRPHLLQTDRSRIDIAAVKEQVKYARENGFWVSYGNVFLWENMRQSMGDLCLYESVLSDPAWIHDYNRVYTDFFKNHFKLLFDEAGLPDGVWLFEDLAYKNGLFASPKVLSELIFPYYAELVDFFKSYNLPVILHSCGNITEALPMIADIGFDALNPMEVKAGCDLFEFGKLYGDKFCFIGGFDVRILETNDTSLIKKEVESWLGKVKAAGIRYFFGSDHSITTNVTYDAYKCAVDTYRENMYY